MESSITDHSGNHHSVSDRGDDNHSILGDLLSAHRSPMASPLLHWITPCFLRLGGTQHPAFGASPKKRKRPISSEKMPSPPLGL